MSARKENVALSARSAVGKGRIDESKVLSSAEKADIERRKKNLQKAKVQNSGPIAIDFTEPGNQTYIHEYIVPGDDMDKERQVEI